METVIHLDKISKIYSVGNNQVIALNSIDLEIKRNEFVAVMGPSGSGKSTLLNILGCLDTPTKGTYTLNKQNVENLSDEEIAKVRNKEIGFIFQNFNLLHQYDALNNIMAPLIYAQVPYHERVAKANELLDIVGLKNRSNHKPGELSGGQKQRVAIARALINGPSVILADEPTGNLDSKTSMEILDILKNVHKMGNTIILVTHEEDIANSAQRIIRFKDGKVEEDKILMN